MHIYSVLVTFCFFLSANCSDDTPVPAFVCPTDAEIGVVNATWGDPDVCRVYYHCINDFPWPRQCPKDLHYNPTARGRDCTFQMCVDPSLSGCTEYDRNYKPDEENNNFYYPCFRDDDGNWIDLTLPNRENCRQYYHCHEGISWISECPPTTYFTPKLSYIGPYEACYFQSCVEFERALCAIDGGWGEWGEWGPCSTECGDGYRTRYRECNNPPPVNGGQTCEGSATDVISCNEGDCKGNATAVFAYRTSDLAAGSTDLSPLEFQMVSINNDNSYNTTSDSFVAQQYGHYLLAINSGALGGQPVSVYLQGSGVPPIGNKRTHRNHGGRDGLSSNMILTLNKGTSVNLAVGAETSLASDNGKPTSWAVASIDDIGSVKKMFSFAYDYTPSSSLLTLKFDKNITDVNGNYNPGTGIFQPSTAGIYFVSIGVGVNVSSISRHVDIQLECQGSCDNGFVPAGIRRTHNYFQGIDNLSRGIMFNLLPGSNISVRSNMHVFSSENLETTFSAFLYQPDNPDDQQATSHTGIDHQSKTGIFYIREGQRLRLRASGNTGIYSSAAGFETSFSGLLLYPA